ncbi:MAG: ferredoxin family protein [Pseudanabaenaceae cyanobacterium bins.68]|nr:ferredoxin family protein [Pseudanabaenaceae cyanobacterium bins.68]
MAYSIATDVCEGVAVCVTACPVSCIHSGELAGQPLNQKGKAWFWIDFEVCIDCGVCLKVCPVSGAVLPYEDAKAQRINLFPQEK